MVRNDDMLIYLRNSVDIIQHSSQDSILTNLQQWLWEVPCQITKPRGVSRRYNYIFHTSFLITYG
jgi:hypothetical protein